LREAAEQGRKRGVQSSDTPKVCEVLHLKKKSYLLQIQIFLHSQEFSLKSVFNSFSFSLLLQLKLETEHTHLMDKTQEESAISRPKAEGKKAIAKYAEKSRKSSYGSEAIY